MTVEEMWQEYAAAVSVPLGGTQWTETRRAFYAGVSSLLAEVRKLPDDEPAAVAIMHRIQLETLDFYERVKRGGA